MTNPWTLIGWALIALFAAASILILIFVTWTIISSALQRRSSTRAHQREHKATRLTAPAEGQTWTSAAGDHIAVVYVGQKSIHVRAGVAELFIDPATWQAMIDRNSYALTKP